MKRDVVIIGAGAAGLMCAMTAGKRGRSVLLLDHADAIGEKIRISGGGRCNFTNRDVGPDNYLSANPHFCKSALARYRPQDFLAMVERHRIRWHERDWGQLFCDVSAQQIIDMLLAECRDARVEIRSHCQVTAIAKDGEDFVLDTVKGPVRAASLVVATGGLSIPKIGASDFGHRIAKQFGLAVTPLRPALVPLTFGAEDRAFCADLSGISLDAIVSFEGRRFREALLFTHRGLSGPAILQISSYWQPGAAIEINLLPEQDVLGWLTANRQERMLITTLLAQRLPKRFVQAWAERFAPKSPAGIKQMAQCSNKDLAAIAQGLKKWRVSPAGTEGYAKAEATLGGVDTSALSSGTMEAKDTPGLFFAGEVLDVTGQLGGYNFQWAWASGHAAGSAA